jgi:iron uptake system component EfeO
LTVPLARTAVVATTAAVLLAAAGCGKDDHKTSGAKSIKVTLTDGGCVPAPHSVSAGAFRFDIDSKTTKSTEFELLKGNKIMGEKENLTKGLSGNFSLRLAEGEYTAYCPGAKKEKTKFTVTKGGGGASADPAVKSALDAATGQYHDYVVDQATQLVANTKAFTAAVRAGDLAKAKSLYGAPRLNYERIEPVAESFGDLDPAIDARIDDVSDPTRWTGFHRLEKALWADQNLAGTAPVADQLDSDTQKLLDLVKKETYQPAQLANGATELLNEVGKTKITGEEERYSRFDLLDIAANVQGSQQAFTFLIPALQKLDPTLVTTVNDRFATVTGQVEAHRQGDGYAPYTALTPDQVKQLSQAVDAVAEPLSTVAGKVTV